MTASATALAVRDVDFSYGRVQVLFGVGLTVFKGETVALLGANGAGKSTLLRVVSGLSAPDRGDIVHNGDDVTRLPAEQRVRRGIVQVTGGAATFPPLTVVENLRAGTYMYGRTDAARRMDRAFELFPVLAERRTARAADLSGGQQQMLALALGLMHDPEVLVIDELTLGLAPLVVQQMVDVIRGLREQGLTMVIVEHTTEVALEIADRAVFMEKGQVRFVGTATEFANRPDLLRVAFLGG